MCAVLLLVVASCVHAKVALQFLKSGPYYVGEDAMATITAVSGGKTNVFTVASGKLPPGCYLVQSGGSSANIKGKPTAAGTYSFTVNVKSAINGGTTITYDYGSVACVMTVRPARNNNGNNTGNNWQTKQDNNTDTGNNGGNTGNNTGGNNGNTGNNGTTGVGGSGGGGGCNSFAGLTAILLAAITLRKSHR